MGVVQLSLFFLLAVHHNRLLQIHSYYNLIWFFSFLESVIRSQGQWRFWSISADSLEKGLQCSPGQAQPRVHWAVTLHPGILHRRSKCLPFLPTPPGDPHQAVTHSLLCSLIQWMFTEHLLIDWKKKNTQPESWAYVLSGRHSEDFKPGTQCFREHWQVSQVGTELTWLQGLDDSGLSKFSFISFCPLLWPCWEPEVGEIR